MARQVLVIEDNPDIAHLLRLHLRDLGCEVELAYEGIGGCHRAQAGRFDLIILDLMLPGMDGMEICRRVRSRSGYTPILMLTSKSSELDRVLGLEMGADDYLTKPFSIMELLARVKAIFRRVDALAAGPAGAEDRPIEVGGLVLDPVRREASLDGHLLDLTAKEFDLLACFAGSPGRVFTRAQLLDQVWGHACDGYEHTVNSHINRLRAKIEANPAKPRYIVTVWGVGYKFGDPAR